jgi:8-oxo-dGTP pyrophosphatase MutT (NUDIX family)
VLAVRRDYAIRGDRVTLYVVGIALSEDLQDVVLVKKLRPDWQAGHFNCPGGKVEPDELPIQAMDRELEEETGLTVQAWQLLATLVCPQYNARVWFFFGTGPVHLARTLTDETVFVLPVSGLHELPLVRSLEWLIPLAKYRLQNPQEDWSIR